MFVAWPVKVRSASRRGPLHGSDASTCASVCRGRLLVGTLVALFFHLLTLLSVRNKPFSYVSEGNSAPLDNLD